jgi:hypothetical protein
MTFETDLKGKKHGQTPVSWENLIATIIDQYYQYVVDISHAVQKDAIQNSWDARGSDVDKWKVEFIWMKDSVGKKMFIMEDYGTTGLTGKILPEDEYDKDLPEEERWGRFQGLAFRRESTKALGARGQGKFVFVGASKNSRIIYDTLRDDGIYRLGVRTLGDIVELEGKEAEDLMRSYSPDLSPLTHLGTRVIIDEPVKELEHAAKSGDFVRYIQTTWWPLLNDYKVNIRVEADGKEWKVTFPSDLAFPSSDTKDLKVWTKDKLPIKRKSIKGLCISRLQICWNSKPVKEDIRGIAVIRGGMVIENIPVVDLLPSVDIELSKRIYGYVEGDMGVQFLLKKIEDPTHYKFGKKGGWGQKNIFGAIKDVVSGELQEFANEKLGLKKGTTEARDYLTIQEFNRIMKAIGLSFEGLGSGGGGGGGGVGPKKLINLVFPSPNFPDPLRRVEYGQEITDLQVKIVNATMAPATVLLRIYTEQESLQREVILDKTFPPIPSRERASDGPFAVKVEKGNYTDGKCSLTAKLVCLDHPDYPKGQELDEIRHIFWVAQDPPLGKGPFRKIIRSSDVTDSIGDKVVKVDGQVVPHLGGGHDLIVNLDHPLYKDRCKNKDDEPEYVIELMAKKLPHVLIAENLEPFKGVEEAEKIVRLSWSLYSELMGKYYG